MSFFVILILIVAVWWLLRPIIHRWMMRQAQKRMEEFFRAATGQPAPSGSSGRRSRSEGPSGFGFWPFGQQAEPRRRRSHKKIDPDVGEYVEFEEIKASPSDKQKSQQQVKFVPEQQIEDAEWEDIK